MPSLAVFRRSMTHSYNWKCLGEPIADTSDHDPRSKSFDKEGRLDNLKKMGRSIQHLLVMEETKTNG